MSDVRLHTVQGDEILDIMYPLSAYNFHSSPPLVDEDKWRNWILDRLGCTSCIAAFEEGDAVAVTSATSMLQNVRGSLYGEAGVWGVSTAPGARRKGYIRQLMTAQFHAAREAGQVFSCLYPFRESFYENLGYVIFPSTRKVSFPTANLGPLLKMELGGEVRILRAKDGYALRQRFQRERLERIHGLAIFDQLDPQLAKYPDSWLALAWVDGRLEGIMPYEIQPERESGKMQFRAPRFYYETSRAKYLLLQWAARHVDQTATTVLYLPQSERPETWLADLMVHSESHATPMGRIIDVGRLGGMWVGPGSFRAEIRDPFCPWNDGTWQFESIDGILQISRAEQAECELSIQALSALVYGTHEPGDFELRGWGNPERETLERMRSLFPPRLPYLDEIF